MNPSRLSVLLALAVLAGARMATAQTAPVITSITPPRQVMPIGGNLTLAVTAIGATSYQWEKDGRPIAGATNAGHTLTNAHPWKDNGVYQVSARCGDGLVSMEVKCGRIIVLVNPLGTVAAWGDNQFGQATPPLAARDIVAIAAGRYHGLGIKADGGVLAWGGAVGGSSSVPAGVTDIVSVAAGENFSLAARSDGIVHGWGVNAYGQVAIPSGLSNVRSVAAGIAHSLALRYDGTVVAWGGNGAGQLSIPPGLSEIVAIAACENFSIALKSNGTVVAWGANNYGQSSVPSDLNGVAAITAGYGYGVALKSDGTMVSWGATVPASPPATLSAPVAISAGGSHLTALPSNGVPVAWGDNSFGQTAIPAGLSKAVAVAAGGNFSLALYDGRLDESPRIATGPTSQVLNLDDRLSLVVSATPIFPGLRYQWSKDGTAILGATNATYTIPYATLSHAGTYEAAVGNYLGVTTSAPAVVSVNPASRPTIVDQPINTIATIGGRATLAFTATGSPTPAFQWYKNGVAIGTATSLSLVIPSVAGTDAGTYTATATTTLEGIPYRSTTNPAILTVMAGPVLTVQPASQSVLVGNPATFSVAVQGLAATTYQWRKNTTAIAGATASSYPLTSAVVTDAGRYTVIVTNSDGSITSNPADLVVNVGTPPTFSVAPGSLLIVANDRAQLSVVASGTGPLTYQWYQGTSGDTSAQVTGATSSVFTTPELTATTSYWVRITDANGNITNSPAATVAVSATSPLTVSQTVMGHGYMAGGAVTVANMITYTGTAPSRIEWATLLPAGWKYVGSGGNEGEARPAYKSADLLEWTWATVPATPIEFTYTVCVPAGTTVDQVIASLVTCQQTGTNYQTMAKPDPLVLRSASLHGADSDRDGRISLLELTRVIELYNYRAGTVRTGVYHPQSGTEDGFAPGPASSVVVPTGFTLIPTGTFTMGDSVDGINNAPTHPVTLSAFFLSKSETTWAEWVVVRGWAVAHGYSDLASAGAGRADTHPVQTVSWYEVAKWCNAKSEKEGLVPVYYTDDAQTSVYRTGSVNVSNNQVKWSASGYRLPTEAEWEYAARGGLAGQRFPWGHTVAHNQANYFSSTAYSYDVSPTREYHPTYATGAYPYTSPAGAFAANGYGLFDMAGNVWEWCWDWSGSYAGSAVSAPLGPASGTYRVNRGGSWQYHAYGARTAYRDGIGPDARGYSLGFRPARSFVQ